MAAAADLLVLASLAGGPKHGYGIMLDVETMAHVRLGAGTLYAVIPRLEERGFIEALPANDRRRPYKLTVKGHAELQRQLESLKAFSIAGLTRLGAS
jgi:DNA-binding PadR family transcriptional regulator